jgi:GDSL-like Lipase/Acylhydrolase family
MESPPEHRGRMWNLYRFIVPLFAGAITIVALELAMSVFHPVPFSIETNMYFEADPYTGFRLKPFGSGHFQMDIPAVANSQGNRDVEVPLKKPPGVFRILVLGDSFTVGANVRQEEAYPKALERRLVGLYGPKVQVVNTGVGGWDPFQYAQYFEHYGVQFEPDLVLVGFFVGNDTFEPHTSAEQLPTAILGHRVSRGAAARPLITLEIFLYDHSNLARLFLEQGPVNSDTFVRKRCDDFSEEYLTIQRSRISNHLGDTSTQRDKAQNAVNQIRRIKDMAGKSVPVVVALLPDENQINRALQKRIIQPNEFSAYDFEMPQSMLIDMFRDVGVPTINLLPAFLADQRCLYMNDTHWTPEGHELVASVILDELSPVLTRMEALR